MAVGLYSGVSGLALGIGLYRNVSGLWGGASGLIDGFGGADPYAGASLYLNFLNPELDSRITFSRGTNATLIDSTGKLTYAPNNLLTFSQEFDNAAWVKQAGTSIVANNAIAPDGTLTADTWVKGNGTTGAADMYRSASGTALNTPLIFSFYAKANGVPALRATGGGSYSPSGQTRFDLQAGTVVSGTGLIQPAGSGWYRCSIFLTRTSSSDDSLYLAPCNVDGSFPVGNGTSGTIFWGAQLEQVTYQTTPSTYVATTASAYYGPRFDYDPVTLAPRGLLIEEARTNLLTYSDDWSNAAWVKQQVTISTNVTLSPDGTANADKIAEDNTTAFHRAYQTINKAASAITYVYTVYIKAAERTTASVFIQDSGVFAQTDINLVTGALSNIVGTVSATNAGNGWWRVSVSGTSGAFATALCMVASNNGGSFLGTTGSGIYVWGAQAEAASFATSYIPTVASTVTRNADVATMTGTNFSSWYNQPQGTFVTDFSRFGFDAVAGSVILTQADDGTTNNRVALRLNSRVADASAQATIVSGGSVLVNAGAGTLASMANRIVRATLAYQVGTPAVGRDGSVGDVAAIASLPTVNQLSIGQGAGAAAVNGHIRNIAYFNTRLPNAQLQTLTAPSLATTLSLDFTTGSYNVGF